MSNPVVLVTGATSGFGLYIAQSFAREGWRVFGTSRDPQRASGSLPFDLLPLDVTSDTSAAECTKELRRRSATLDVLVNNAGIGIVRAAEETTMEEARQQVETNFFGVVRMNRQFLPPAGTGTWTNHHHFLSCRPHRGALPGLLLRGKARGGRIHGILEIRGREPGN
jgi:NAD(P)-dependent dehydrogenase (short-subunit alcohol dehydrogenase family)